MKSISLQNVKGGYDYFSNALSQRNNVIDILKDHFQRFGYQPLETTILCYFDLLSSKYAGGAEILKEVYRLSDQGQRDLGLRYDLTVPFCKAIAMNKSTINFPFRRYEIGKVFRDGPVKAGRSREFYQCDIDVVGINGQTIELEMISMAVEIYKTLGINFEIQYGNRKLLSGLIVACGFPQNLTTSIILSVDKIEKIGQQGVFENIKTILDERNICVDEYEEKIQKLFCALSCSLEQLRDLYDKDVHVVEGINEIDALRSGIESLGLENRCRFVASLARGLEVYTGNVWEVFDKDANITSSLGGGGRYDNIITNFMNDGNQYPAVGMSFGLEPICAVLAAKATQKQTNVDLMVIPMDTQITCIQFANRLREKGLKVLVDFSGQRIKKIFSYADKENIPFVCVIGHTELYERRITIKRMDTVEGLEKEKSFMIDEFDLIIEYINEGQ